MPVNNGANPGHRRSIRLQGYDYAQAGVYFVTMCTQDRALMFGEVVAGQMRLSEFGGCAVRWWDDIPRHFPSVAVESFVVLPNHIHGIIVLAGVAGAVVGAGFATSGAGRPRPYTDSEALTGRKADAVGGGGANRDGPDRNNAADALTGAEGHGDSETPGATSPLVGAGSLRPGGYRDVAPVALIGEIDLPDATTEGRGMSLVGAGSPRPEINQPLPGDAQHRPVALGSVVAYFKYQSAKQINVLRQTPAAPVWQRNYYEHVIRDETSLKRIRQYIADNPARWALDRDNPLATDKEAEDAWLGSLNL
jgi:putative transposase